MSPAGRPRPEPHIASQSALRPGSYDISRPDISRHDIFRTKEIPMPARKSSSNGKAPRRTEAPARAPKAAPADAATDATSADADPDQPLEDVPMNRAQRRAKGKHGAQPRPVGKILPGRTNLVHGPRAYSNRRSGGGG